MLTKVVNITSAAKTLMLAADAIVANAGKPAWLITSYVLSLEGTGYIKFWSAATDTVTDATNALSGEINPGTVPLVATGTMTNPVVLVPSGHSFWIELNGGTKITGHFSYMKAAGR